MDESQHREGKQREVKDSPLLGCKTAKRSWEIFPMPETGLRSVSPRARTLRREKRRVEVSLPPSAFHPPPRSDRLTREDSTDTQAQIQPQSPKA